MKNKQHSKKHKKFRTVKFLKVSTIYFVLFMALSGMIDYYALMEINVLWFLIPSLILALGFGYYHTVSGKRDHIDDVADEFL